MSFALLAVALATFLSPTGVKGLTEEVLLLRSFEDPGNVTPDPSICNNIPAEDRIGMEVLLGASLYKTKARNSGRFGNVAGSKSGQGLGRKRRAIKKVGEASACGYITETSPGSMGPFSARFELNKSPNLVATGSGTVTGSPTDGVLLVGFALDVPGGQYEGLVLGTAAGSSVFNLRSVDGFDTGSFWTLRLFFED